MAMHSARLVAGQRVADLRMLRGWTQDDLAQRLHRSTSWLSKVERGERRLDRPDVLAEVSDALGVPPTELTDHRDPALQSTDRLQDPPALAALKIAVDRPTVASRGGTSRPLTDMRRQTDILVSKHDNSPRNYSAVLPELPDLLSEAQSAARTASGKERSLAHAILADLYRLAWTGLRHRGDSQRARVAVRQAIDAADAADDPVRIAAYAATFTLQLWLEGEPAEGVATALEVGRSVSGAAFVDDPAVVVALGALHATAAMVAARAGDRREARHLLQLAAGGGAMEIREDRGFCGAHWGPVNAATYEMVIHADLHQYQDAARLADRIKPEQLGNVCRTGHYYVHSAWVYHNIGDDDRALAAIEAGLRVAHELTRTYPVVREIIRGTVRRRRQTGDRLRILAREVKLID